MAVLGHGHVLRHFSEWFREEKRIALCKIATKRQRFDSAATYPL
jgi:hypothetical protein